MKKTLIPIIVLFGQKNVGKSMLFNRLTCTNNALVDDYSGLTRDRQYGYIKYKQFTSIVVDTGGFDIFSNVIIQNHVNSQTILAVQEAHIILYVINGKSVESSVDYDIVCFLRKFKKDIFVVVNKIDDYYDHGYISWNYYSLGIKDVVYISAMHGYGIENLLKVVFLKISKKLCNVCDIHTNRLSIMQIKNYESDFFSKKLLGQCKYITLAVVGRPNSGKSTFINYILKISRVITSDIPGTTRDSIYIPTVYDSQKYMLIDTAGVRKKKQIDGSAEKISVTKTLQVIKNADVTLFMIDVNMGIVDQDLSLLRFVIHNSKSVIIVFNKWDGKSISMICRKHIESSIQNVSFLNFSKVHFISSLYGNGISILFNSIQQIYQSSVQTISTARLIQIMREAIAKYPPRACKSRIIPKLKYIHIGGYHPPVIVIHGTQLNQLSDEYRKYLKKYFYCALKMYGVSIRMRFKDTIHASKHCKYV